MQVECRRARADRRAEREARRRAKVLRKQQRARRRETKLVRTVALSSFFYVTRCDCASLLQARAAERVSLATRFLFSRKTHLSILSCTRQERLAEERFHEWRRATKRVRILRVARFHPRCLYHLRAPLQACPNKEVFPAIRFSSVARHSFASFPARVRKGWRVDSCSGRGRNVASTSIARSHWHSSAAKMSEAVRPATGELLPFDFAVIDLFLQAPRGGRRYTACSFSASARATLHPGANCYLDAGVWRGGAAGPQGRIYVHASRSANVLTWRAPQLPFAKHIVRSQIASALCVCLVCSPYGSPIFS